MSRYKTITVVKNKSDVQFIVESVIIDQKGEFDYDSIMKKVVKQLKNKGDKNFVRSKRYLDTRVSNTLDQMVEAGCIKPTAKGYLPQKRDRNKRGKGLFVL